MFQVYCIHGLLRSIRETGDLFEAIHRPGRSTSNCLNTATDTEETHIVARLPVIEEEGRGRALGAAHSIAERIITELLVMHQNQQQISTLLWSAVRRRGCQFLGPVMQEEILLKFLRTGGHSQGRTLLCT